MLAFLLFLSCAHGVNYTIALLYPLFEASPDELAMESRTIVFKAVEAINADPTVLPGDTLHFVWANTQYSQKVALGEVYDLISEHPNLVGIVGWAYSYVLPASAMLMSLRKVPVISSFSTSPGLVDKTDYPYLWRASASSASEMAVMAKICLEMNWLNVGVFVGGDYGNDDYKLLQPLLEENGISIRTTALFVGGDTTEQKMAATVEAIASSGVKIIIVLGLESGNWGIVLSTLAKKRGITGPGYVWMCRAELVSSETSEDDLDIPGIVTVGRADLHDAGGFSAEYISEWASTTVSNDLSSAGILNWDNGDGKPSLGAHIMHDITVAFCNVLHTVKAAGGSLFNGEDIRTEMNKLDYLGVATRLKFTRDQDLDVKINVVQHQETRVTIGVDDFDASPRFTMNMTATTWGSRVPHDGTYADGSVSSVAGSGLFAAVLNQAAEFTVVLKNSFGEPFENSSAISVEIDGPTGKPVTATQSVENGTIAVTYTPTTAGVHTVCVRLEEACIGGPASVTVAVPEAKQEHGGSTVVVVVVVVVAVLLLAAMILTGVYLATRGQIVENKFEIDHDALIVGKSIGTGSFGSVFAGEWRGSEVAIKKLHATTMTRDVLNEFTAEVNLMCELRHPNCVLFMGACTVSPNLMMVTELMDLGSVHGLLQDEDFVLAWDTRVNMICDAAKGMNFLHMAEPPILHRDLKSLNLLVNSSWVTKVADFGMSGIKKAAEEEQLGSVLWAAPEVLSGSEFTTKCDVYSFGVTAWEIITMEDLYEGQNAFSVTTRVMMGTLRPTIPADIPSSTQDFLNSSLAFEPDLRPSFQEICEMLKPIKSSTGLASVRQSLRGSNSMSSKSSGGAHPFDDPATVVAISVDDATALWGNFPLVMQQAAHTFAEVVRKQGTTWRGYELVSNLQHFVFAFRTPADAINFACSAQVALFEAEWPPELSQHPSSQDIVAPDGTIIQRGLRACVAVHAGQSGAVKDRISGRIMFGGPLLDECESIRAIVCGGQILATEDAWSAVGESDLHALVHGATAEDVVQEGKSLKNVRVEAFAARVFDTATSQTSDDLAINYDDLTFGERLGMGSFGETFKGVHDGKVVAIKRLLRKSLSHQLDLVFTAEVTVMRALTHPNVIKLIGATRGKVRCIVTEFAENGTLEARIADPGVDWTMERKLQVLADVSSGMQHLHSMVPCLLHRDLKSSNILIDANWQAIVADLGLARIKSATQTMTVCGTAAWTAPEIIDGEAYTEKADVYSFAIVCWEVFALARPYAGHAQVGLVMQVAHQGLRPPIPADLPEQGQELLTSCWNRTASERPSFTHIVDTLLPDVAEGVTLRFSKAKSEQQIIPSAGVSAKVGAKA